MPEENMMRDTVIVVTGEGMGRSERELQLKLIATYLNLLAESNLLPNAICLYADGVRLAVEGSPVLNELRTLEEKGVRLILCSTCLNYLGLIEQVRVGIVGGMPDIIAAQAQAAKVITL